MKQMTETECSACSGTGRVYGGEICTFCETATIYHGLHTDCDELHDIAEWMDSLGKRDNANFLRRLAARISAAPVAIMDTRDVIGLCAPTEDDFAALYALQGRRVRLVLDDVAPNASGRAIS